MTNVRRLIAILIKNLAKTDKKRENTSKKHTPCKMPALPLTFFAWCIIVYITTTQRRFIMWWASSSGKIELFITKSQARKGYHSGPCDADIKELRQVTCIQRQLNKVCPTTLAAELAEYGAWDASELQDHEANLDRLLWLACADITENL